MLGSVPLTTFFLFSFSVVVDGCPLDRVDGGMCVKLDSEGEAK